MGISQILVGWMGSGGVVPGTTSPFYNPLDKAPGADLSESDKRLTRAVGTDQWAAARGTTSHVATDPGGFYVSNEIIDGSGNGVILGIGNSSALVGPANVPGFDSNSWSYYGNGGKIHNGISTAYGPAYNSGDIVDYVIIAGKLWFRVNGTWIGDPVAGTGEAFSGITGNVFPMGAGFNGGLSSLRFRFRTHSLPAGAADW